MAGYKLIKLHNINNEQLELELKKLLELYSSSSAKLSKEEFARIKAIALELKRRGIISKEVAKVLNEI